MIGGTFGTLFPTLIINNWEIILNSFLLGAVLTIDGRGFFSSLAPLDDVIFHTSELI